jgi:hypothetical protein
MMRDETDDLFPDGWRDNTDTVGSDEMEDLRDQLICERHGFDLEEMRAERVVREGVREEAETYLRLTPEKWPALNWNWDFSAKAQRYVYDGMPPPSFTAAYPAGLRLGWVQVVPFDAKLSYFHRRNGLDELWALGDQGKLAEAIAYNRRGHPFNPDDGSAAANRQRWSRNRGLSGWR